MSNGNPFDTNPYRASESEVIELSADYDEVKFFSWSQRIGRLRYFAYNFLMLVLLSFIFGGMPNGILRAMGQSKENYLTIFQLLTLFFLIIWTMTSVIYAIRRLHDLDKSGWWILLYFVPLINFGLAIYLLFFPGSEFENRFGKKPKPNTVKTWICALIPAIIFIGILAAVAIPAYQDYVYRSKTHEAYNKASQLKPVIESIYHSEGTFDNADTGKLGLPDNLNGDYTRYVNVSDGVIIAEINERAGSDVAGKQFIIHPTVYDDKVIWSCFFSGPEKLKPVSCVE
ncbi:DUF805 domain-containing protein [Pleionea sediminis]|uniref:DUF805 domain-containing protein n=1 Tax=Pleionea sediminis TaxID=2569479 RepID=UPI001184B4CD|nr:DUF805 domain-containing protein [Pleionea sediminis]